MYIKSIISCRQGWEKLQQRAAGSDRFQTLQRDLVGPGDEEPFHESILDAIEKFEISAVRLGLDEFASFISRGARSEFGGRMTMNGSAMCQYAGPGKVAIRWSSDSPLKDGQFDLVKGSSQVPVPPLLQSAISQAWRALFPFWEETNSQAALQLGRSGEAPLNVGLLKSGVAVNLMLSRTSVDSWLFHRVPVAFRRGALDLAIGVFIQGGRDMRTYVDRILRPFATGFQRADINLRDLQPITLETPFVLLGLSTTPVSEPRFVELQVDSAKSRSTPIIERVIEVPPQYQQAVVGILGYFGTYLQQIAPEQARVAKIRIEQGTGFLRLVVEADDGARHILERAFEDYQGVVRGDVSVDQLQLSPIAAAELRSELRIANARIDFQKDMLVAQGIELRTLRELSLELSKREAPDVNIHVSTTAQATATASVDTRGLVEGIERLAGALRAQEGATEVIQELDSLGASIKGAGQDPSELSGPMARLRRLLEKIQMGGARMHGALEKSAGALDAAQKLARKYNSVAGWCGLPQVPGALLGGDD